MLKLKIVSPSNIAFDGEVEGVVVPGTQGQFEILKDHAPIISSLEEGIVTYFTGKERTEVPILGGFVEVKKNEVSLCVEVVEE